MRNKVPPAFSKERFDLMAPHIGNALKAWPEPVTISVPKGVSITTFYRQFNNAIRAKNAFHFTNDLLPEDLWLQHNKELAASYMLKPGYLVLGPRTMLRYHDKTQQEAPTSAKDVIIALKSHVTQDQIKALCALCDAGIFTPTPQFSLQLPLDFANELMHIYPNIALLLVPDTENTYTLV